MQWVIGLARVFKNWHELQLFILYDTIQDYITVMMIARCWLTHTLTRNLVIAFDWRVCVSIPANELKSTNKSKQKGPYLMQSCVFSIKTWKSRVSCNPSFGSRQHAGKLKAKQTLTWTRECCNHGCNKNPKVRVFKVSILSAGSFCVFKAPLPPLMGFCPYLIKWTHPTWTLA